MGLINGRIITFDPKITEADGLIIDGDKFGFVGPKEKVKDLLKKRAPIIDLKGKTVIPGFIDSHTHLLSYGIEKKLRVDLSHCRSKQDVLECIVNEIKKKGKGEKVIGINWDQSLWRKAPSNPREIFNRYELDRIAPFNPVVLRRICGHIAFANSSALKLIDRKFKIVDWNQGLLLEDVVSKINQIFWPDDYEISKALDYAIEKAHQLGITSIHEMVDQQTFNCYLKYYNNYRMKKIRTYAVFPIDYLDWLLNLGFRTGFGNEFLRIGGIKIYLDGSIGARTACLTQDYLGDKGNKGLLLYPPGKLTNTIKKAEAYGFQILIHSIGDRATHTALRSFRTAGIEQNLLRHRIEHAELIISDHDLDLIKQMDILISSQPNFIGNWGQIGGMYERYLGHHRWLRINRFRTLSQHRIKILFGSDCMPPSPLYGLYWALNHPVPKERIKLIDALKMYTINGAYGSFEEILKGSISANKIADLVILDGDLFNIEDIQKIKVFTTILGGEIVYQRF